jgi:hypothetical protein
MDAFDVLDKAVKFFVGFWILFIIAVFEAVIIVYQWLG